MRDAGAKSLAQIQAEVALGALADAGLTRDDVDGFFCGQDAPGTGPLSITATPRAKPTVSSIAKLSSAGESGGETGRVWRSVGAVCSFITQSSSRQVSAPGWNSASIGTVRLISPCSSRSAMRRSTAARLPGVSP